MLGDEDRLAATFPCPIHGNDQQNIFYVMATLAFAQEWAMAQGDVPPSDVVPASAAGSLWGAHKHLRGI